jgi:ABC-2 type transport system ATP-binding protein
VLRDLSLWDKRHDRIRTLSGGMKRRVLIAKALAHEPEILFLDEPTAGVDVELRRDMWALVRRLRDGGVTIILTTHYIDEAEEMADRIGRDQQGRADRGRGEGRPDEEAREEADDAPSAGTDGGGPRRALPIGASRSEGGGTELEYTFDAAGESTGIPALLRRLDELGITYRDLNTRQSSLEDIFVSLVSERA